MTGIVRNALNIPPAPFVSWPNTPWDKGIRSSLMRASNNPTRNCVETKSAPLRLLHGPMLNELPNLNQQLLIMRFAIAPTISNFSLPASISTNQISLIGSSSFSFNVSFN